METQSSIRFVLDGQIHEIGGGSLPASTTVLDYLRLLSNHKGVKEGCGEGDCGACTIVIAELNEYGNLVYKAVNSCLMFLPMLHGKQLITIENLAIHEAGNIILHPVQQALVDHYGSQCGYCTPGMVMSMFALYKNFQNPNPAEIQDNLSGNLCRCTGYVSINEAVIEACKLGPLDHFTGNEDAVAEMLREILSDKRCLLLQNNSQTYFSAFSLEDALEVRDLYPGIRIVAGATDLAVIQNKKQLFSSLLLDISQCNDMDFVMEDHGAWYIGGACKLEYLREFMHERLSALSGVLEVFGSRQVRNSATIGGNICNASPIGDLLPLLMVLDCSLTLMSKNGKRQVKISDFITGYRQTLLTERELLVMITIPRPSGDSMLKSYKLSRRREVDISTVSAAFYMNKHNPDTLRIAFGGMADRVKRASLTETFLSGKSWTRDAVEAAMDILESEFQPISDARAQADSRRILAGNLLLRFYLESREGI
jgi:xanthine dehydrogenase small subunit